jgi:hypothetical protein
VVPRDNLEALQQAARSVKVPEGRQPIALVGVDSLWEALPYVFEHKYRPRFVTTKATQADDDTMRIDGEKESCGAFTCTLHNIHIPGVMR